MLTDYTIDLNQKFLYRLIGMRSRPVDGGLVDANASKHNIGSIWYIDAQYSY